MASEAIEVRRVYDDPRGSTGEHRVLVDRLWPRGIAKGALRIDEWAKDLAPSTELRRWYGHQPERFEEFARRYLEELRRPAARQAGRALLEAAGAKPLVLLTATRDVERSGAAVLARHLRRRRR
jgi:uncharacterized protein YeaO (DUF488 family)